MKFVNVILGGLVATTSAQQILHEVTDAIPTSIKNRFGNLETILKHDV